MRNRALVARLVSLAAILTPILTIGCGSSTPAPGWVSPERGRTESGQPVGYRQFQRRYRPHDRRPTADREAIKYMIGLHNRGMLTPLFVKHFIADLLAEGQCGVDKWRMIMVGVPRKLAGQLLDKTEDPHRARLLNTLPDTYALDILYYAGQATYNAVANDVAALAR